jgi:ABC-type oligopeptide transport system substrate-binding subunit
MRSTLSSASLLLLASACGGGDPPAPSGSSGEARRLLAEAGYPGGRGFPKLSLLYNRADLHQRIAAAVQELWRTELGIHVELVNAEWKVFLGRVDRGDFDIARGAWVGEYADPHAFLDLFRRDSPTNRSGWSSDEYEKLVEDSLVSEGREARLALLDRAEQVFLRDLPAAPVYHYVSHNYIKPFVKGVHSNSRDMHPLQHVWLEGEGTPADGVLVFNAGEEPGHLDPALSRDIGGLKTLMNLFEGLVGYDPKDASPVPAAAERWETSADQKTWTFRLREATWSNGDPLTAADFVDSWRRAADPATASPYVNRLFVLRNARRIARGELPPSDLGVQARDARTLVVQLEHPAPWFPELLCLNVFYPVHLATVARHGDRWTLPENLVHNGPYRLASWKVNDRKVFEKNPLYWGASAVRLQKFVFLSVPDDAAALRMYEAGQCHWLFRAPLEALEAFQKRPDYRVGPYNAVYYYQFNTKKKPLDDVRVRRALSLSIDREKIVKYILRGGETAASRLVPPPSLPR